MAEPGPQQPRAGEGPRARRIEDVCFDAQQAAEKAIKAVMILRDIEFPYVHDLDRLLSVLEEDGEPIPAAVRHSVELTKYAVVSRYPMGVRPVSEREYLEATDIAEAVVGWAEGRI